ncbi:sulfatase-like hydrolase/transferase [Alcaligenaceae bacterium]|nr:sulfatase-like hydrolase/transferase [Alcaligenaceae bacterium]
MNKRLPALLAVAGAAFAIAGCNSGGSDHADSGGDSANPNILFVIMDDVGIDQMKSFGYGGDVPPYLPNMDAVTSAGVRFRNTWSMPECSPGRAAFFLGRYPLRTNIYQAIGPKDLANSQISPYDTTTPKLLKQAHYENAMFGKFHLAGPENNEAGNATPKVLGWDYFYGWVGGLPGSIDTTAGGVAAAGTHMCGFVAGPSAATGAKAGACYQANGSCSAISSLTHNEDAAGLQCLDSGGIFVPKATCGTPPASLVFNRENGYYVSPLVIIKDGDVEEVPLTDPRARGYRTRIETDAAIDWIKSRAADKPWMATVSYSAAHTPWQQPPRSLFSGQEPPNSEDWDCTNPILGRGIQNQMTEAMDTEFGRLLVETGLASRNQDGSLNYDPKATNTVIVIVGDNGSLGTAVKRPFSGSQAKGTAYQTGVWDPLIIAGPQVVEPGRAVEHMVNTVDLYQFFGELAGLDVHKEVQRTVDSVGILPYLTNPGQASLRTINFTMAGMNIQADNGQNGPCVITATGSTCTQIPTSKSVCGDNLGVWWGPGYDPDKGVIDNGGVGYPTCAHVNQALFKEGLAEVGILPQSSIAIRNDRFKLVRNTTNNYFSATDSFGKTSTEEMFEINQAAPVPLLDTPDRNLLPTTDSEQKAVHKDLSDKMDKLLASNPDCPGDGNIDGVVNAEDIDNWARIARQWGLSSVYDFVVGDARDGKTNNLDESVIQNNLNKTCKRTYGVY